MIIRYKSSTSLGIIDVVCPNCENHNLRLKERIIIGIGSTKLIDETWWECPTCVHTFGADWFNKIKTYEKFVERIKGFKIKFGVV